MDRRALEADGWKCNEGRGFTAQVGPFWTRDEPVREMGILTEARHGNDHLGTVHGGVLMTFADLALGYGVARAIGGPHCVTVQLQIQLVATGKIGEFIHCQSEVVRRTSQLVFARGLILAGDRTIASADGIWKLIDLGRAVAT